MVPSRLATLKANELSFGWALISKMVRERWTIERVRWGLDPEGRGVAIYRILPPGGPELQFAVLSVLVPEDEKGGTAYATKFDMVGSLIEGEADDAYLETFRREIVRKPTEGQAGHETLSWVRANKSARGFDLTVEALASGRQPDAAALCGIGYLLRSVYYQANGACGTRAFHAYEPAHPLRSPYAPQSLCSYMAREFGNDLADHLARSRSERAVRLSRPLRRYLGLGNSTGLGLVILVINHPRLIDRWISLRERAIGLVTQRPWLISSPERDCFSQLLNRCIRYRRQDGTDYGRWFMSGRQLADELGAVARWLDPRQTVAAMPEEPARWADLCGRVGRELAPETLESVYSLLIDAHPDIVQELWPETIVADVDDLHPEISDVDPAMSLSDLRAVVNDDYAWALEVGDGPDPHYWGWFKAVVGEYPGVVPAVRVPRAFEDYGWDVPLGIKALQNDLAAGGGASLTRFLLDHPQHRTTVQWVQCARQLRYGTVRMNVRARDYQPMQLTRFVLEGLKGFEKMEPVDDHGGRAIIMQGAPTAAEIAAGTEGLWAYPGIPCEGEE
jgi:hypothetical protein